MPNALAYIVLFSWPLWALIISKKVPIQNAAILLLLVPYLFFPEKTGFDLPGIPPLDKNTIPSLTALAIVIWSYKYKNFMSLPKDRIFRIFIVLLFIFPLLTFLTNRDSFRIVDTVLPAMSVNDLITMEFRSFCRYFIPFLLGYKLLSSADGHRVLLKYFLFFGLIYSILMIWEIRFSPQLHTKFYGFFPHSFAQQIRDGGFRPVVFTSHGLIVALLCAFWLIMAIAFYQARDPMLKNKGGLVAIYFGILLVFCKSMGAILMASIFAPIFLFVSSRRQLQLFSLLAIVVIAYPVLRFEKLFPIDFVLEQARSFDDERAGSLEFRVVNEEQLLQRASERKLFGWGMWGRNRVFDPETGEDISVTDGFWVILLGTHGLAGYLVVFGIMTYPIVRIKLLESKFQITVSPYTRCIIVILVMNLIDLLPNASVSSLTLLLAGSLCGTKDNLDARRAKMAE